MKSLLTIIGIILILFSVISFSYQGFTYTKQEKIAEIGNMQLTANTEKTISLPPIVGGVSLVAGIVLVVVGRIGRK